MDTAYTIVRIVHVITAILMAWPIYALVAVNNRALLGPPLGDRADTYLENVIKNRTLPCFVFQATALISGLALVLLRGLGMDALVSNPVLGIKFVLLLLIVGLLSYVALSLQPRIDSLFSRSGTPIPADAAASIGSLRLRRKRIASICRFVVLVVSMLGVQVWEHLSVWVTVVLVAAAALFTWRAFKTVTPYGWV